MWGGEGGHEGRKLHTFKVLANVSNSSCSQCDRQHLRLEVREEPGGLKPKAKRRARSAVCSEGSEGGGDVNMAEQEVHCHTSPLLKRASTCCDLLFALVSLQLWRSGGRRAQPASADRAIRGGGLTHLPHRGV